MSVDVASQTTLAALQKREPRKGVAGFTAGVVRKMTPPKCVNPKLDPDPNNPAHAIVCPKLSVTEARQLAQDPAIWVYCP